MLYQDNWQKDLNKNNSLNLIILFIVLFICYEYTLFSRLVAQKYFDKGLIYLDRARSAPKELLVKKSLFYQDALKLLKRSIKFNHYDSRDYFNYAEALTEIRDDYEISMSIDIKSLDNAQEGREGFYNLAKLKYIEATLREPTNAIYHQRLGSIYDKLSDPKKAEEEFMKAVLLDPQNVSIHLYLSQYFLSKNREADFLRHLNKVVELYKLSLKGGGPVAHLGEMVCNFLKAINREELIKE